MREKALALKVRVEFWAKQNKEKRKYFHIFIFSPSIKGTFKKNNSTIITFSQVYLRVIIRTIHVLIKDKEARMVLT